MEHRIGYPPKVSTIDEVLAQNRILRERIERLESEAHEHTDPLLQALLQHAPAFLTVITPEGRFLATGRTSEAFGSVVGRTVFEFVPPHEHGPVRAAYARVCATKQPVVYESLGYGENGEPNHTYVVRAVPVVEDGAVDAIVLVPTDITERVQLERSLARSEESLRFAVAAARMGLWRWDMATDELHWDPRALEIFGVATPPKDFDRYLALIHPDDVAFVKSTVGRAVETGVFPPFEHRLAPRADGVERWVLGTGTVRRDPSGKPTALMGGALEITEQRRAAAQLQRAQRVEALGQLTAGLAHNFNNLLGAIIPNLELALEQGTQGPQLTEPLHAAMDASLQARDLIKRLMSMTRPRVAGTARASDPREAVERAVAICRATFPRELEVTTSVDPEIGHVPMDPSDLDQILLNLLFNARDALERTTGRARHIEVSLDRIAGARSVRLRVRDNGEGMSPAVRARVFEPFFTTKPAHRGGGLGLADALIRVRAVDGELECQSVEGEGTTFLLLLPEAPTRAKETAAASAPAGSRGETILIVDDEADVRTAVARLLKRQGYRVLEANSADEARAALAADAASIKLLLLDHSMPYESGPEAIPSLKLLSDAPIVLFTGGASELPPGAAALLEKPALAAELLKTVHDLIAR
ncbi:MAG: domain S-box-containing protein [Myxococcales bacterium]|nr:domain S-box-containing protein [Myxococcales bacterium]